MTNWKGRKGKLSYHPGICLGRLKKTMNTFSQVMRFRDPVFKTGSPEYEAKSATQSTVIFGTKFDTENCSDNDIYRPLHSVLCPHTSLPSFSYLWLTGIRFKCVKNPLPRSRKPRLTAVGIRCADHATPSTRKSWH
jgi:hypothetical protein